jgi:MFS family permease
MSDGILASNTASRADPGQSALRLAALVGTSSEWYDFFLYATAAAVVFPTVFFPGTLDPSVALLASFSTFAVGFIARPLGAVFFGHLGDKAGRKTAFAAALLIMGLATTSIGLLPSYKTAGVLAPVALVLLRLLQGWGPAACN